MDRLELNVVFVPGTVRYLRYAVLSLLNHTPYDYVVVNNALPPGEAALLERLVEGEPRLRYVDLGVDQPLPHGQALNRMFRASRGSQFAFVDSDVFAVSPFHEELDRLTTEYDIVTSCHLTYVDPEKATPGFMGRNITSPAGQLLGSSHMAVYRRRVVRRVREHHGVRFEHHPKPAKLARFAGVLRKYGWDGHPVDTAKLLNVLALEEGFSLQHQELGGLVHLGGISSHFLRAERKPRTGPLRLDERSLPDLAPGSASTEEATEILRTRRRALGRYFSELLMALEGTGARPVMSLPDSAMKERIQRMEAQLEALVTTVRTRAS